jgi:hypothetical protein
VSTRATARHRSDAPASTPLTVLAESVTGGLQLVTTVSGRNGAALAVTTGLMATMGLPATSADTTSGPDRAVTTGVALGQNLPADLATGQVTAAKTARVRFERRAFVVALPDDPRSANVQGTADAAADVARTSRSLARAAYQEQQARSTPRSTPRSAPASAPRSKAKPQAQPERPSSGVSGASCSISRSIESHLASNARSVYRAVCAAFRGSVSAFGGYRAGDPGDHGSGRAVDIMVSGEPGHAIARYVQAHARELHVTYVIYQQRIWLAGHPTSQWRLMEDRGSRTANHYDHVHVSVS